MKTPSQDEVDKIEEYKKNRYYARDVDEAISDRDTLRKVIETKKRAEMLVELLNDCMNTLPMQDHFVLMYLLSRNTDNPFISPIHNNKISRLKSLISELDKIPVSAIKKAMVFIKSKKK
jgi:hypothetical protein